MIVIGIDGATWDIIRPNLESLPNFRKLLDSHKHSVLECDVRPVHSSASWTTIFTGLAPERHGITEFVMDEGKRRELIRDKMFIWNRVGRAIVMCVPISLPPMNVNFELRNWEPVVLSTTEEEMYTSTRKLLNETLSAIEYGDADLVAVVFSETDRVGHMFWHQKDILLRHYQSIDSALGKLMPLLEKNDFLILSDHGFTDAEETRKNGWDTVRENQSGGHHPDGVAISNIQPPQKTSQICAFMERVLQKK
jgi:predicted AlkP superfamily phosphohydrolase/phosphomutase